MGRKKGGRRVDQIARLLLEGLSEKEVAGRLRLSIHTVHVHVKRLYRERGVESRAELMAAELRRLRAEVGELHLVVEAMSQRPN